MTPAWPAPRRRPAPDCISRCPRSPASPPPVAPRPRPPAPPPAAGPADRRQFPSPAAMNRSARVLTGTRPASAVAALLVLLLSSHVTPAWASSWAVGLGGGSDGQAASGTLATPANVIELLRRRKDRGRDVGRCHGRAQLHHPAVHHLGDRRLRQHCLAVSRARPGPAAPHQRHSTGSECALWPGPGRADGPRPALRGPSAEASAADSPPNGASTVPLGGGQWLSVPNHEPSPATPAHASM